ncbi:hypothetical protein ID866_3750 [Astraeus odoratus]|nr:hypothetical protein ID866_3750 [Astraeus odoratus]
MSGSTATRKQALATPQVNKHSTSEHPKAREPPITIEEGQVSNPPINNSDNYNHDHTQDAVVAVAGSGTTRKQALATSQAKKHSTGQPKAREPLITIEEGQISNSAIDNSDNYEPTQDAAIEEVGSGTTGKQELPTSQTNKQPLEVVEVDQLDSEDVIIAIMGPTGAGKSSFVSKATGIIDESVGHMLTSHTSEIRATKCVVGGSNVVLVDTPGFDDTKKSDLEILQSISDWLTKTYKKEALLSGLLYFHRITDNRMAGTPLKNLRVFQKLCGNKAMSQIVLTTTMWDEVDEEVGIERLTELQGNYWKGMIARGSTTFRYWNTPESARTLLWQLVDRKRREVRLQKEIGDKDMELAETDAAQELQSRLDQAAATQRQVLERIRAQLARTTDPTTTADLWKQYEDMKAQLDETMRQTQALNLSSVKRTVAFIRRKIGL